MKKRIIALMLAFLMCISAIPALAIDGRGILGRFEMENGIVYWLGDGKAFVCHILDDTEYIHIPSTYQGLPVTLYYYDFSGQGSPANVAKEIIIEDGVGIKDSLSFGDYLELKEIRFPKSVYELRYLYLNNCPKLLSLDLPQEILTVSNDRYLYLYINECPNLTYLSIPNKLTSMEFSIEDGCTALREVYLPPTLQHFYYNDSDAPGLEAIHVAAENPYLYDDDGILYSKLDNCLVLAPSAMQIDTLIVPEDIEKVSMARLPSSIKSIHLPASCTEIFFIGRPDTLEAITVSEKSTCLQSIDGVLYTKDDGSGITLLAYPPAKGDTYEIVPGTTEISGDAFYANDCITSIVLPESVAIIDPYSFAYCTRLRSLAMPEAILHLLPELMLNGTAIAEYALPEGYEGYKAINGLLCSADGKTLLMIPPAMATVIIPEGIVEIADFAIPWHSKATSLSLPSTLKNMLAIRSMLDRFSELERITVAPDHPTFIEMDGVLFSRDKSALLYHPGAHGRTYEVPLGTTKIGIGAFQSNDLLESLTFPPGITELPPGVLNEQYALSRLALPSTLKVMGNSPFDSCLNLRSVILPEGLTTIEGLLSMGLESGAEITYPGSLETFETHPYSRMLNSLIITVPEGSPIQKALDAKGVRYRLAGMPWEPGQTLPVYGVLRGNDENASIPLYDAPGGNVIDTYPPLTTGIILSSNEGYTRITIGDEPGYVEDRNVLRISGIDPEAKFTEGHTQFDVTLYSLPSPDGTALCAIPQGEQVILTGAMGIWYEAAWGGKEGYAEAYGILPTATVDYYSYIGPRGVIMKEGLSAAPLYAYPSSGAPILGYYYSGQQVIGRVMAAGWYLVETEDGQVGFIPADDMVMVDKIYGNG